MKELLFVLGFGIVTYTLLSIIQLLWGSICYVAGKRRRSR